MIYFCRVQLCVTISINERSRKSENLRFPLYVYTLYSMKIGKPVKYCNTEMLDNLKFWVVKGFRLNENRKRVFAESQWSKIILGRTLLLKYSLLEKMKELTSSFKRPIFVATLVAMRGKFGASVAPTILFCMMYTTVEWSHAVVWTDNTSSKNSNQSPF